MSLSSGRQWPIGIAAGTVFIVFACAMTIYIALLQPVEENSDMMAEYHTLDANVNKVIVAGISFDRKYKLTYIGKGVSQEGSVIAYRVEDLQGKPVNEAQLEVILTRPITHADNFTLGKPRIENGNYYFDHVKVPHKGRWNILARVSVNDEYKHMNLKSDTMQENVFEYGFGKEMRNAKANGGRSTL